MDEITRTLYGADPAAFTATRAALVAQAKASGDAKAAAELAKLRKPTVGAWAINLLAIHSPSSIQQLTSLATRLRDAQRDLQGGELRKLAQERRTLIPALVAEAQKLAGKAKLPVFELEATLNAALAETTVAQAIQSGRLLKTATSSGTGFEVAEPAQVEKSTVDPAIAEAREAEAEAQAALERTEAAERVVTQELTELDDELHELRQRRAAVAEELNQARHALRFAQRALTAASRRVYELDPGA